MNLGDVEIYSCKSLGAMPSNIEKGIPRASGTITLFDSETKSPVCILDAQVISAIRTGAVSALAAKKLMPQNLESICLIGAGVNMRTQLMGMKTVFPNLQEVFVYSRGNSKYNFSEVMSSKLDLNIIPVNEPEVFVKKASAIITLSLIHI